MGIHFSADVVYGVSFTRKEFDGDIPDHPTLGNSSICGDYVAYSCTFLYVKDSVTALVNGYEVPVPIQRVADIGQGIDTGPWRDEILAFCRQHGLPEKEPAWIIACDVC